ncbi:hypothetical protein TVAG_178450 [Trichomonas vaginalis G3]|uniref:Uncharacterized protein n=1 Tax=Trichomonas vaginalis (strain ATCC PRA-98 / G3) TaxID=412133 RepID=A2DIJ7_TRIV3|nr:hypothetical protein TVAGG3_0602440 [Trichomonas vaginalis G3]EAY19801.1 hypothetical protein TVAG_178450 [Trichomonas vaginalis G3]KAI5524005.1 hypothetical protein TVAGG3_0602440 [Trichomonas vaginalis G3]|eukprot:XP_001580787.1 hypothetical protein [Trichomonas vaginalis G3]
MHIEELKRVKNSIGKKEFQKLLLKYNGNKKIEKMKIRYENDESSESGLEDNDIKGSALSQEEYDDLLSKLQKNEEWLKFVNSQNQKKPSKRKRKIKDSTYKPDVKTCYHSAAAKQEFPIHEDKIGMSDFPIVCDYTKTNQVKKPKTTAAVIKYQTRQDHFALTRNSQQVFNSALIQQFHIQNLLNFSNFILYDKKSINYDSVFVIRNVLNLLNQESKNLIGLQKQFLENFSKYDAYANLMSSSNKKSSNHKQSTHDKQIASDVSAITLPAPATLSQENSIQTNSIGTIFGEVDEGPVPCGINENDDSLLEKILPNDNESYRNQSDSLGMIFGEVDEGPVPCGINENDNKIIESHVKDQILLKADVQSSIMDNPILFGNTQCLKDNKGRKFINLNLRLNETQLASLIVQPDTNETDILKQEIELKTQSFLPQLFVYMDPTEKKQHDSDNEMLLVTFSTEIHKYIAAFKASIPEDKHNTRAYKLISEIEAVINRDFKDVYDIKNLLITYYNTKSHSAITRMSNPEEFMQRSDKLFNEDLHMQFFDPLFKALDYSYFIAINSSCKNIACKKTPPYLVIDVDCLRIDLYRFWRIEGSPYEYRISAIVAHSTNHFYIYICTDHYHPFTCKWILIDADKYYTLTFDEIAIIINNRKCPLSGHDQAMHGQVGMLFYKRILNTEFLQFNGLKSCVYLNRFLPKLTSIINAYHPNPSEICLYLMHILEQDDIIYLIGKIKSSANNQYSTIVISVKNQVYKLDFIPKSKFDECAQEIRDLAGQNLSNLELKSKKNPFKLFSQNDMLEVISVELTNNTNQNFLASGNHYSAVIGRSQTLYDNFYKQHHLSTAKWVKIKANGQLEVDLHNMSSQDIFEPLDIDETPTFTIATFVVSFTNEGEALMITLSVQKGYNIISNIYDTCETITYAVSSKNIQMPNLYIDNSEKKNAQSIFRRFH